MGQVKKVQFTCNAFMCMCMLCSSISTRIAVIRKQGQWYCRTSAEKPRSSSGHAFIGFTCPVRKDEPKTNKSNGKMSHNYTHSTLRFISNVILSTELFVLVFIVLMKVYQGVQCTVNYYWKNSKCISYHMSHVLLMLLFPFSDVNLETVRSPMFLAQTRAERIQSVKYIHVS